VGEHEISVLSGELTDVLMQRWGRKKAVFQYGGGVGENSFEKYA
jgi:hypothetical protein